MAPHFFCSSHEKAGSQPEATSVASKLQSPAWGRRVQSLSLDGDVASPPNASILALEAQRAQSGRSCSGFKDHDHPALSKRIMRRFAFFRIPESKQKNWRRTGSVFCVSFFFCRMRQRGVWSGEFDRARKRREQRLGHSRVDNKTEGSRGRSSNHSPLS